MEQIDGDKVLRAMTDDGGFRVIVADTTETVRGALAAQKATGEVATWMGELLTGTILIRETMAPTNRVQSLLQGAGGRGVLVADSHPDGGSRALAQNPKGGRFALGDGAVLQVMRTLPSGAVHKGTVSVPDDRAVASAMMAYLHASEQVTSAIAMATVIEGGEVRAAAGYLVQLLPELSEADLALMTARLETIPPIEALLRDDATPEAILKGLLDPLPYTMLADSALRFQCRCDSERLRDTLSTLSNADLEELISEGKDLEIECDWCHAEYRFTVDEVRALIARN